MDMAININIKMNITMNMNIDVVINTVWDMGNKHWLGNGQGNGQ
jgi:hypothetical protein